MKKVLFTLMCLAAMLAASMSLKAQEVTITLNPGWTWISYLGTEPQGFATALGSFTPEVGDVIKSQWGNATYMANGQWKGSITQFYPGYGYMYKSTRAYPVSLTLTPQQPAPQVVVTTLEPTNITAVSAVVGGIVIIGEGNHIFARGVCWGTEPNPTIDDNHLAGDNVAGSQSFTLDGLNIGTIYYVRAYAATDNGLAYGNEMTFTTGGGDTHPYIDLGLPSGLLWATCNVGADNPEDYGDYFAWGETQPKDDYSWSTYQYSNGSFGNALTKYCTNSSYGYNGFTDNLTNLLPEDDAATANWGGDWRMPTKEEWQELRNNTTVIWTAQNGVYGRLFTAANGNSIFLPAAGFHTDDLHYYAGSFGDYWSSSLNTDVPDGAWGLDFGSGNEYNLSGYSRQAGFTVRPVRSSGQSYTITVSSNPTNGGSVSGGGTYDYGQSCTLTATPNTGYDFVNWTENGNVVSTNASYTFTVTGNRTLIANFRQKVNLNVYAWPVFGNNAYTNLDNLDVNEIKSKPCVSVSETETGNAYKVIEPGYMDTTYGFVRMVAALPSRFSHNTPGGTGDGFFMTGGVSNPTNDGDYSWATKNIDGEEYIVVQSTQSTVFTGQREYFFGKVKSSDALDYVRRNAILIDISSELPQ